jgi:VWFA-related protein
LRRYPQITRISLILFVALSVVCTSLAQTPQPPKRKKVKDFGSSLKRLKWNAEKNAAVQLPPEGVAVDEDEVIRIETSLVSSELLVLDSRGLPVSGLTAGDFLVKEDEVTQTVGHFLTGDNVNAPRSIVLIIDYSGSQLPYIKDSVKAAKVMVDKLGPRDLMAIVTDDVELFQEFTSDKKKLKNKLDDLYERTRFKSGLFGLLPRQRVGLSKQYSALMATLNEAFDDEDVRPIIVFQTDGDEAYFLRNPVVRMTIPDGLKGDDRRWAEQYLEFHREQLEKNDIQFSLYDLYRTVEKSRATVYTVVPGPKLLELSAAEQLEKTRRDLETSIKEMMSNMSGGTRERFKERIENRDKESAEVNLRWTAEKNAKLQSALAGVAPLSGGWTEFLETPEQADAIYARIFSDINQRYIVGYYPTNKERNGLRRRIHFEVKGHPEYQVMGRRSYFAPER